MRIRGFAMPHGVCFSNGKQRVTGRIQKDGKLSIHRGTRWFWRFSIRQWLAAGVLLGIEFSVELWPGVMPDALYYILVIGLFLGLMNLEPSHRRFHGAEHIAVNLWEGRTASVLHPGCGSNLVLLLLPGLALSLLPLQWYYSLAVMGVYAGLIVFVVWPFLYRGVRRGEAIARVWWKVTSRWQRLFVAEPLPQELRLAREALWVLTVSENSDELRP